MGSINIDDYLSDDEASTAQPSQKHNYPNISRNLKYFLRTTNDTNKELLNSLDKNSFREVMNVSTFALIGNAVKRAHKIGFPPYVLHTLKRMNKSVIEVQNSYRAACTFLVGSSVLLLTSGKKEIIGEEFIGVAMQLLQSISKSPFIGIVVLARNKISLPFPCGLVVDTENNMCRESIDKGQELIRGRQHMSILCLENFDPRHSELIDISVKSMQAVLAYKYRYSKEKLGQVDQVLDILGVDESTP